MQLFTKMPLSQARPVRIRPHLLMPRMISSGLVTLGFRVQFGCRYDGHPQSLRCPWTLSTFSAPLIHRRGRSFPAENAGKTSPVPPTEKPPNRGFLFLMQPLWDWRRCFTLHRKSIRSRCFNYMIHTGGSFPQVIVEALRYKPIAMHQVHKPRLSWPDYSFVRSNFNAVFQSCCLLLFIALA